MFDLVGPTYNNVVARGIISACNADQGGDYVYYAKFTDTQLRNVLTTLIPSPGPHPTGFPR